MHRPSGPERVTAPPGTGTRAWQTFPVGIIAMRNRPVPGPRPDRQSVPSVEGALSRVEPRTVYMCMHICVLRMLLWFCCLLLCGGESDAYGLGVSSLSQGARRPTYAHLPGPHPHRSTNNTPKPTSHTTESITTIPSPPAFPSYLISNLNA